jgi:hypothetical protein
MSVIAKCLIATKYASNADTVEYTAPAGTHTIIDKFTATNIDSSARTLTVYLCPSGNSPGTGYRIISALSIAAGATYDSAELRNQILNVGDTIAVVASLAATVVIRASGREVT